MRLDLLGSARVSRVGDGVLAIADFPGRAKSMARCEFFRKIVSARRQNQHARRVRYPIVNPRYAGDPRELASRLASSRFTNHESLVTFLLPLRSRPRMRSRPRPRCWSRSRRTCRRRRGCCCRRCRCRWRRRWCASPTNS